MIYSAGFSAVAYHFALKLHKELGVPVGIVQTAWGGKPVETFTRREALAAIPDGKRRLAIHDKAVADYDEAKDKARFESQLKKWEESKNKASVHFSESLKSKADKSTIGNKAGSNRRPPGITPINCEADAVELESWEEPPESPGTVHIACGALSGEGAWSSFPQDKEKAAALLGQGQLACGSALAMAGIVGSPKNASKESRSVALQNAMGRAKNEGLVQLYGKAQASGEETKILGEREKTKSSSTNSSSRTSKEEYKDPSANAAEGPLALTRKQVSGAEVYKSFPGK